MNVYKTVEKQAKIFGLSIMDVVGIVCLVVAYVILSSIAGQFGWNFGMWGMLFLIILLFSLIALLRFANKKKCPNYILAMISFNHLQPKKIQPKCPLLKASPEFSKTKISTKH